MSVAHAYNILQQILGTEVTEAGHKLAIGTAKVSQSLQKQDGLWSSKEAI